MKHIFIFIVILIFTRNAFATNEAAYRLSKDTWFCNNYSNAKLVYDVLGQNDETAFSQMFTSGKCLFIKAPVDAYQMTVIGPIAEFRIKGSTVTGWGLRQDLKAEKEKKKKN